MVTEEVALEESVERDVNRSEFGHSKVGLEEFDPVRHHERYPVATLHAVRSESGGDLIGPPVEFCKGVTASGHVAERPVRRLQGAPTQQIAQSACRILHCADVR
ncbi:hypothetical protein TUM20985_40130 [Mycobacterium antarcticum]|nr:hypothetical protein TUM20985_40130 [Mycolicibacterium sp. TUM20985]GLP82921.1 hypothetical protein TUM20984_43410 [Mycolicibacterium sp. TUM20984]